MKKSFKKLGLNKLTISNLNNSDSSQVIGGLASVACMPASIFKSCAPTAPPTFKNCTANASKGCTKSCAITYCTTVIKY